MDTFERDSCDSCPGRVVCKCLGVTEDQIVTAIQTHDLSTIRDIRHQTSAGDGCTCCHQELQQIIDRCSLLVVN